MPEKRRGRPPIDSEAITLRLPRHMLDALDFVRERMGASRPQAVRTALEEWLRNAKFALLSSPAANVIYDDMEDLPDMPRGHPEYDQEARRIRRQGRSKIRRAPVMAVVDPTTLAAVDAASLRRGLTRSAIIGEILAGWASQPGKQK
jgi:Ribbon-helix-helix protein, copG family